MGWVESKKRISAKKKLKFVPQATEYLKDLITVYKKGLQQPLAFDPKIIEEFCKKKEGDFFQKIAHNTEEDYYFGTCVFQIHKI